jgi:CBS domain-containing protein
MPTQKLAKDIMTKTVLRASDDWNVNELARFLTDHGISGAPVVNADGRLVGVVSVTDVARATGEGHDDFSTQSFYQPELKLNLDETRRFSIEHNSDQTVRQIMTPLVFEVEPKSTVADIADTMVRGRIHRVFVVEGGLVVGVVSALDLLQLIGEPN